MDGVVLLTVIGFVVFMGLGMGGPLSSLYAESLQANYVAIGLLSTAGSLTSFIASYFWGRRSDRMARRKTFIGAGLAVHSLSTGLMAFLPDYRYLFPLRILTSLSQAAYNTTSLALMGDLLERRRGRGRTMGVYRGLSSLGFAAMAFVGGSIADRTSLKIPFLLEAGLLALAFGLSLLVRDVPFGDRTHRSGGAESPMESPSSATRTSPSVTPLLISGLILSLSMSATLSVWANYLVNDRGYTPTMVTRLWSLTALSEAPFLVAAGWLSDRVGRLPILTLGLLCWVVVLIGYAFVPIYPWILLIQLLRGFAFSAFTATAMVYITEVSAQSKRGQASGLYSSSRGLGSIVGGALGGLMTQVLGFPSLTLTCAGLLLLGAIYLSFTYFRLRYVQPKHLAPT
jgi:MFS family permease